MSYASNTSVSIEKSRGEIERTLTRYGADQFAYAQDVNRGLASVSFHASGRHIRFILRLPNLDDEQFKCTPSGRRTRTPEKQYQAWEQACRQRWRALALCIKAKLEAVEAGISQFEEEFLAHIVLPDGGTVGQLMTPQIEQAYLTNDMPSGIAGLLPAPEA